jgi:hypothetical protein
MRMDRKATHTGFFGMPRIKLEHEKCMFFLFNEERHEPAGTGFIVGRSTGPTASPHFYGVTNHHVAQGAGGRIIVLNTKAGHRRKILTEDCDWHWVFDDDLAIIDITNLISSDDDFSYISESEFTDRSFIEDTEIGIGDEVFLVGLFAPHAGKSKNIASGKFGSLSIVASDDALVPGYEAGGNRYPARPRFIADMRSRPGYSGSPVFVYRTLFLDLRNFDGENYRVDLNRSDTFVRLLGVHCAQFNDSVKIDEKSPVLPGKSLRIPGAMAVVIPAWKISALLHSPKFAPIN